MNIVFTYWYISFSEEKPWLAMALTEDHKPESLAEKTRIENNGGKVVIKSGVPRVVWNKPRVGEGKLTCN